MTSRYAATPFVFLFALQACGPGGSDFGDRFEVACSDAIDMPAGVCECLAERAGTELSEDAQALLLAMLEQDQEAAERLRGSIPVTDAMQAGMFLTEAGQCAPEEG